MSWALPPLVTICLLFAPWLLAATADAAPKALNGFIGAGGGENAGGLFTQPYDVAVYTASTPTTADDKVFVAEAAGNNSRVHRLDRDGNFEVLWGRDVVRPGFAGNTGQGAEVCEAAVSGATGCKSAPTGGAAGEVNRPTGLVVDQTTGHVYVVDRDNLRVQEFELDGDFVRSWGWDVAPDGQPGDTPAGQFEICTSVCKTGVAGGSGGQFAAAAVNSIAISPVAPNHLFVTDAGNQRVLEFELDGDFVRGWGFDVAPGGPVAFETCTAACQPATMGSGASQYANAWPQQIALDQDGTVYTSDSNAGQRVVRFDSDPAPPPATDASALVLDPLPSPALLMAGTTTGLEVDPDSGNLFVARDNSGSGKVVASVQEIADAGSPLTGGPPNPAIADTHQLAGAAQSIGGAAVRNIGLDTASDNLYVTQSGFTTNTFSGCTSPNGACTGLAVLAVTAGSLSADLDAPADVGTESVSLAGLVDPAGGVARYRFQVSADGADWIDASAPMYVAGAGGRSVSAELSGLQPATLYRVRMIVSKQDAFASTTSVTSNEDVFLTDAAAPAVRTLGSSERTDISARLRGQVDPNGSATSYHFEYGPAGGSFDHHVPIPDAQAGSGNDLGLITHDLSGLQADTAYHYRIVATNFVGATVSDAVTFTTRPAVEPPPPPAGRGFELVSPADKLAGVGVGIWYQGPVTAAVTGFAAHDGERFAVQGTFGAVLVDGEYSFANDWALAERGPHGWMHRSAASRRAHGSQTIVFANVIAATPDISMTAWNSNAALRLFEEIEDWNVGFTYLRDWAGNWESFAPTEEPQGTGPGDIVIAADARSAVATAVTRGLAGDGDPTLDLPPGTAGVYRDEVPNGLSDSFPGSGVHSVVNVCDDGTEIPARVNVAGTSKLAAQPCGPTAPGRSAALVSSAGASMGDDRDGVIAADGSRVFFMSPKPVAVPTPCSGTDGGTSCPSQLYVSQRTSNGPVVRWVSRSEVADQEASLLGPAYFEGASADGDKVFFRTPSPLTADDPNGDGAAPVGGVKSGSPSQDSWDLYMYDLPDGLDDDPDGGDLVRISAGPTGDGDCNSPFDGANGSGALRFLSEDGSRLLFTCAAALDGVTVAGDGTVTEPAGDPDDGNAVNLYAYDTASAPASRWRFVARLPRISALGRCATSGVRPGTAMAPANEQVTTLVAMSNSNCMHGTPDGGLVTFVTDGQLTGDDPDAASGDVYAYDIDSDELTRVSGPQGGVGGSYPCRLDGGSPLCYGDDGISPPGGGTTLPRLGVAQDPESGDKLVFFESRSRLVPLDADDDFDVYQWRNGQLSLLSAGDGDAMYLGNDQAGRNVYFATRDRLTWQDRDVVLDVYTARVGGGIPEPPQTDEICDTTGGQCHGPGAGVTPTDVDSDQPNAGNPPQKPRIALAFARISTKARKRAARTGRLKLRVKASSPTTVSVVARARLTRRVRKVAMARTRIAGAKSVTLELSRSARKRLASRKPLKLTIAVTARGSRGATSQVTLRSS